MGLPDVVYVVRRQPNDDELRYSLRSLANLPHRRVWIAGHRPRWARVGHIDVPQRLGKWANQEANLAAACAHPEVADRLVVFNDDFFVVEPIDAVPALHRGLLADVVAAMKARSGEWVLRMRDTARHLGDGALAYDALHTPLPATKAGLAAAVAECQAHRRLLYRTVYGNRAGLGGVEHPDVKVSQRRGGDEPPPGPFVSTADRAFAGRAIGQRLRAMFPNPSPYEAP